MNILQSAYIYVLPFLFSLVYFSVSSGNARSGIGLKPGTPMKTAVAFAVLAFTLLFLGYFAAGVVASRVEGSGMWVTLVMFMLISVRVALHAFRKKDSYAIYDLNHTPIMMGLAAALGINMLFAGVGLRFMEFDLFTTGFILAGLIWLLSFSGLLYGKQFNENFGRGLELFAAMGIAAFSVFIYLWEQGLF